MITRVHHQTIKAFVLPEMLSQKWRMLSRDTWFEHLQNQLAESRKTKIGEFNLVPVFDYSSGDDGGARNGGYEERFWSVFRGAGAGKLPCHFPFKIVFDRPTIFPDWTLFDSSPYQIRIRGRVYPYGAVCLRISEYLEPMKPMTPEQVIDFFSTKLENGRGNPQSRDGILGNVKDRIIKSLVKHGTQANHDSLTYRLVHFETTDLLDFERDWDLLRRLLSFSSSEQHLQDYPLGLHPNLGFERKKQIVLLGKFAGIAWTPNLIDTASVRSRKCLRNRIANLTELVMIQKQYFQNYNNTMREAVDRYKLSKGRTLEEIRLTLGQNIPFEELKTLYTILGFEGALKDCNDPPGIHWREWLGALSSQIFPLRSDARDAVMQFNEADVELRKSAADAVVKALDHLIDIYAKIGGSIKPAN